MLLRAFPAGFSLWSPHRSTPSPSSPSCPTVPRGPLSYQWGAFLTVLICLPMSQKRKMCYFCRWSHPGEGISKSLPQTRWCGKVCQIPLFLNDKRNRFAKLHYPELDWSNGRCWGIFERLEGQRGWGPWGLWCRSEDRETRGHLW
jgi:hypothetical protein